MRLIAGVVVLVAGFCAGLSASAAPAACRKVVLSGQVAAGSEWHEPVGQGWVLRLVPVAPSVAGYTGWDLAFDREPGAGFPDALLLATPPYDSPSEREIATTFGLRAQDALGWNPRSFHFLTDPADFAAARKLYAALRAAPPQASGQAAQSLLKLASHASSGRLRILDARIAPGTGDAVPYARNWALQASKTQHTMVQGATPTPRGALDWMRFEVTLWLPTGWHTPPAVRAVPAPCE